MSKAKKDKRGLWEDISKKLKRWELRLIELRNEGLGYNEIRDLLQREFPRNRRSFNTNKRLRNLLYVNGRLHKAYIAYGDLVADESFEQGQLIIKNLHKRASMTVGNLLSKGTQDQIRLGAAKDVLDRNAGKATGTLEIADSGEMEELRSQVNKLSEENENITRLSERIKNTKKRTGKGKKHS